MLNLDVYRQAKSLQKTTNSQVVKVVYKNSYIKSPSLIKRLG